MKRKQEIKVDHLETEYIPELDDYELPEEYPFDPAKMRRNLYRHQSQTSVLPPAEKQVKPKSKRKSTQKRNLSLSAVRVLAKPAGHAVKSIAGAGMKRAKTGPRVARRASRIKSVRRKRR